MNFKNSLLVTVPEGVQELEVMKAMIFTILNNGFSFKIIVAGFLFREQQRWIGYWDRHCRRPQWVCPHPCFHHHPIKKGRIPQKTLSLPSSSYYFICHYHLHINQSDKKTWQASQVCQSWQDLQLFCEIPTTNSNVKCVGGSQSQRWVVFVAEPLYIRNRNWYKDDYFGGHLRRDIPCFA